MALALLEEKEGSGEMMVEACQIQRRAATQGARTNLKVSRDLRQGPPYS